MKRRCTRTRIGLGLAAVLLLAAVAFSVRDAAAQASLSMRESIYTMLSQAEQLSEQDRLEDALKLLRSVEKKKDLSGYEKSQLYTAYGYFFFSQENYAESIQAYKKILAIDGLPEATTASTLYTLAQLYFQVEDYEQVLTSLNHWLLVTENPGPEPYMLQARALYLLQRYRDAIAPIETAMAIARHTGKPIAENWYGLLRGIYYELEDYARAIEILEVLVTEHPRKEYWLSLASLYGMTKQEQKQLATYEIAYLQGHLERSEEVVLYAQLLLQGNNPYRAATVLGEGIESGVVEESEPNLRLLSQAWTSAKEDERAIAALRRAATLAEGGELEARLAQAYLHNQEWRAAADASRLALKKGVADEDQVRLLLGMALFELEEFEEAKAAFRGALDTPASRPVATQWLAYIEKEQNRLDEIERAITP